MRRARLISLLCLWAGPLAQRASAAEALVAIPPGRDTDLRFFGADGSKLQGVEALRKRSSAGLEIWLAGNQFFAMPTVVAAFQKAHPGISVSLLTLPPGLILEAIRAGGWTYAGERFPGTPDVYGSVSLAQLEATGQASSYAVYMHNALELMVAKGNPKQVHGLADLVRPDLKVMLPNPITEGIMTFYGEPILKRLGLWKQLSPGADCSGCDATPTVHFAAIHHREIPAAIVAGKADVGLVWRTEVLDARRRGDPVAGVTLSPAENASAQVLYLAGALKGGHHPQAAAEYLKFLLTPSAQEAYGSFGFIPATAAEHTVEAVPAQP